MKRLKMSFLAVCFAAVAAVLFFTAAPLRTEAAEEEKTVTIDGVVYTLGDLNRGTYGEARLKNPPHGRKYISAMRWNMRESTTRSPLFPGMTTRSCTERGDLLTDGKI